MGNDFEYTDTKLETKTEKTDKNLVVVTETIFRILLKIEPLSEQPFQLTVLHLFSGKMQKACQVFLKKP